jgi:hypothetical protein
MKRKVKPRIAITDPAFIYKDSASTNVAETFRKARERMAAEESLPLAEVTKLKRRA